MGSVLAFVSMGRLLNIRPEALVNCVFFWYALRVPGLPWMAGQFSNFSCLCDFLTNVRSSRDFRPKIQRNFRQ
jgi:hypothetical protein